MGKLVHSGCGYDGPATWDEKCPNCRDLNIRETLTVGKKYRCVLGNSADLGEVELKELVRENIGGRDYFNGIALVRPVRVIVDRKCGETVFREGTARDEFHVGTLTLSK